MKKTVSVFLLLITVLSLSACSRTGGGAPAASVTIAPAAAAASATDTSSAALPAASSTDTNAQSTYSTARNYIGRSTRDMFAAIGQPGSSTYSSTDDAGSQEGMLFYDGFYVWTTRTNNDETVQDVYLDQ